MKFIETKISDVIIIEPTVFGDNRGYFLESYNQKKFEEFVGKISFVQDNESKSSKESCVVFIFKNHLLNKLN